MCVFAVQCCGGVYISPRRWCYIRPRMLHTAKFKSISHDILTDVCYVYHRLRQIDKEGRGKILHPFPVRETVCGFFDRTEPPAWREILRPCTRTRWTRRQCVLDRRGIDMRMQVSKIALLFNFLHGCLLVQIHRQSYKKGLRRCNQTRHHRPSLFSSAKCRILRRATATRTALVSAFPI
jgi:hypothetical protein